MASSMGDVQRGDVVMANYIVGQIDSQMLFNNVWSLPCKWWFNHTQHLKDFNAVHSSQLDWILRLYSDRGDPTGTNISIKQALSLVSKTHIATRTQFTTFGNSNGVSAPEFIIPRNISSMPYKLDLFLESFNLTHFGCLIEDSNNGSITTSSLAGFSSNSSRVSFFQFLDNLMHLLLNGDNLMVNKYSQNERFSIKMRDGTLRHGTTIGNLINALNQQQQHQRQNSNSTKEYYRNLFDKLLPYNKRLLSNSFLSFGFVCISGSCDPLDDWWIMPLSKLVKVDNTMAEMDPSPSSSSATNAETMLGGITMHSSSSSSHKSAMEQIWIHTGYIASNASPSLFTNGSNSIFADLISCWLKANFLTFHRFIFTSIYNDLKHHPNRWTSRRLFDDTDDDDDDNDEDDDGASNRVDVKDDVVVDSDSLVSFMRDAIDSSNKIVAKQVDNTSLLPMSMSPKCDSIGQLLPQQLLRVILPTNNGEFVFSSTNNIENDVSFIQSFNNSMSRMIQPYLVWWWTTMNIGAVLMGDDVITNNNNNNTDEVSLKSGTIAGAVSKSTRESYQPKLSLIMTKKVFENIQSWLNNSN